MKGTRSESITSTPSSPMIMPALVRPSCSLREDARFEFYQFGPWCNGHF